MSTDTSSKHLDALVTKLKSAAAPFRATLNELHAKYQGDTDGTVATYIPELAKADPQWFGISVVSVDGQTVEVGDYDKLFSIQSVSKPFVFGLALEDHGREHVLSKVSVEPTGEAFNSIVLDETTNRPFNPLVNAGAIATADLVEGKDFSERISRLLTMFGRYIGRPVYVDNSIFMSERATGHRNRAIAHLMLNFGMIQDRVEETLELYFQQCSLLVNCHDLAVMGATLANRGVNPLTGENAIKRRVRQGRAEHHALLRHVRLRRRMGLSRRPARQERRRRRDRGGRARTIRHRHLLTPLDAKGNSVRGVAVCRELSERFGLHAFEASHTGPSLAAQFRPRGQ